MSKRLVILAGSPRGGEETWDTLFKYVVEPLNADLAICCGSDINKKLSIFQKAKYKWLFDEHEDWYDYYENKFSGTWREYFETGRNTGLKNSGSVHFAIKNIILENYLSIIENYDQVIYSRFDQFYVDYHPELNNNFIWIPEGEDYFGICDRHTVFPSKFAKKILDICNYIDNPDMIVDLPAYNNCETTFLNQLKFQNLDAYIQRMKRFQFTVQKKGDLTRWRVAKYNLYFKKDIKMKYPTEFVLSINELIKNKKIFQNLKSNKILVFNFFVLSTRKYVSKFLPRNIKDRIVPYIDKDQE
ncbi:MAG: hypothetical protein CBC40_06445 [bacterium TMED80]|nr:MAG: hypothetical protein CBC40_06445 [bacterium TMED80]|tara:strand:+ start:3280 stop:4179 length:900 start_codon:yes stop_codon:yes gene_type:complete